MQWPQGILVANNYIQCCICDPNPITCYDETKLWDTNSSLTWWLFLIKYGADSPLVEILDKVIKVFLLNLDDTMILSSYLFINISIQFWFVWMVCRPKWSLENLQRITQKNNLLFKHDLLFNDGKYIFLTYLFMHWMNNHFIGLIKVVTLVYGYLYHGDIDCCVWLFVSWKEYGFAFAKFCFIIEDVD